MSIIIKKELVGFGIKLKGKIKTKYKYEKDLADNLTKLIAFNFNNELASRSKVLNDNTVEFKNSILNYAPFNYAITIFNFSIDRGIVKVIDESGRLVLTYKVQFINGLIFLYLFVGFLGYMILPGSEIKLFSEEILVLVIMPPSFIFIGLILSLRFLNILLDKSLKNRYKQVNF